MNWKGVALELHPQLVPSSLSACQRGAVSVEYLMVFAVAGLTLALTLASMGPDVVQTWARSRRVLYGPYP